MVYLTNEESSFVSFLSNYSTRQWHFFPRDKFNIIVPSRPTKRVNRNNPTFPANWFRPQSRPRDDDAGARSVRVKANARANNESSLPNGAFIRSQFIQTRRGAVCAGDRSSLVPTTKHKAALISSAETIPAAAQESRNDWSCEEKRGRWSRARLRSGLRPSASTTVSPLSPVSRLGGGRGGGKRNEFVVRGVRVISWRETRQVEQSRIERESRLFERLFALPRI